MDLFNHKALQNLTSYKYSSQLTGFLDRVIMTPFWNWAVTLLPMWLAPNLVTVFSLLHAVVCVSIHYYFNPQFDQPLPRWVHFVSVYLLFMYQTLDAIDGKQARRTGASSPLGQLFDHGCDALCCGLSAMILCSTLQTGHTWFTPILFFLHFSPFFIANWEEIHTGVMRFGVVGVTEGQYLVMGIILTTGLAGDEFWKRPVMGIECRKVLLVMVTSAVVYQMMESYSVVRTHLRNNQKSFGAAWSQLRHYIVMGVLCLLLMYASEKLLKQELIVMMLIPSILFGYMMSRLIIAHVTHSHHRPFHSVLIPLPVLVANSWARSLPGFSGPVFCEWILLRTYLAVVVVTYVLFVSYAIRSICNYLGISWYRIKPKQV